MRSLVKENLTILQSLIVHAGLYIPCTLHIRGERGLTLYIYEDLQEER